MSFPSAIQLVICLRFARPVFGSRAIDAPQNTPTISQPLSSVRLSGTLGNVAGRKADDEITSFPIHRAQGGLGIVAANGIVKHVRAFAAGQALDVFGQLLLLIA